MFKTVVEIHVGTLTVLSIVECIEDHSYLSRCFAVSGLATCMENSHVVMMALFSCLPLEMMTIDPKPISSVECS
jgi:hypothetical protein